MTGARTHWGHIGLVIGIALTVRLVAAVVIESQVSRTPGRICLIEGDAAGYWELASQIAHGKDYVVYNPPRRVLRMPGFPVVLAASRLVFGDKLFAARCWLCVIGAIGCGLTYRLGCEVTHERVALLAGLATALSPPLVAFSPLLLSETTFATTLLLNLLSLAWVIHAQRPSSDDATEIAGRAALLAGLTGALATFMRPTWLPVVPLTAVLHCSMAPLDLRRRVEAVIMVSALMAAMSPWVLRNAIVTGRPVVTTLWDGPSLYDGLHPGATGGSDMTFFEQEQLLAHLTESEMNRNYRERAWAFARMNPRQTLELAVSKELRFWSPVPNADQFADRRLWWGLLLSTVPLYFFSLCGLWAMRRDLITLALTAGPILFFSALHLLFVGSIRYRLPAEYPLWILAAIGAHAIWQRWRSSPVTGG